MVPGRFPGNPFVWGFIKMLSRPPSEPEPSHPRVFVDPPTCMRTVHQHACAPCTTRCVPYNACVPYTRLGILPPQVRASSRTRQNPSGARRGAHPSRHSSKNARALGVVHPKVVDAALQHGKAPGCPRQPPSAAGGRVVPRAGKKPLLRPSTQA
jgi:hypothetical protein